MAKRQDLKIRLVERYQEFEVPMHVSFTGWADHQAARPGSKLVPIGYDPDLYPEQTISEVKTLAQDTHPRLPDAIYYPAFRHKVGKSLGHLTTRQLLNQFNRHPASSEDSTPLPQALIRAQEEGQNTMVITPHFKLAEIGYFKALKYLAKNDRGRIHLGATIMNKLMTRQQYGDRTLTEQFRPLGNILWSLPKSNSSDEFGVPVGALRGVNALLHVELDEDLAAGGLELDVAPTGSELKEVMDAKGALVGYSFPEIDPGSASLVERFDNILPAALLKHPSSGDWRMYLGELLPTRKLLKENGSPGAVVDTIFAGFQREIRSFTGREAEYRKVSGGIGSLAVKQVR